MLNWCTPVSIQVGRGAAANRDTSSPPGRVCCDWSLKPTLTWFWYRGYDYVAPLLAVHLQGVCWIKHSDKFVFPYGR